MGQQHHTQRPLLHDVLKLRSLFCARRRSGFIGCPPQCRGFEGAGSRCFQHGCPDWTVVPILRRCYWSERDWTGSSGPRFRPQKFETCPCRGAISGDRFFKPERFERFAPESLHSAVLPPLFPSGSDRLCNDRSHKAINTHSLMFGLRREL